MQRFTDNKSFTTERFSTASLFIVFNERKGKPFSDTKARRAVAKIVDQEAFVQAATNGLGEPATSFVSGHVQCANTDGSRLEPADADPAAINGVSLTQVGTQAVGKGAGNTYIAQVLGDAGAEVELRTVDNAALVTELATKPDSWDMTVINLVNISSTLYGGLSRFTGPRRTPADATSPARPTTVLSSRWPRPWRNLTLLRGARYTRTSSRNCLTQPT